jgi:hypothetical protein
MKPATYQTFDAITRLQLEVFLQRVFAELNPGTEYLDNFPIHVLIDELEDLRFGRRRRLAVAMPPRSLKSLLISVAYVAWLLGHDPGLRIICVSYGQELADKLASDCRQIMLSAWYQRMFPGTRLAPKRQALGNFETTAEADSRPQSAASSPGSVATTLSSTILRSLRKACRMRSGRRSITGPNTRCSPG